MSLPKYIIDSEFEELESKALRGIWDDSEQERLFLACGMDELKNNNKGTNYSHTRLSHLMAIYSAFITVCDTQCKEMEVLSIGMAKRYLKNYPSSSKFFLPLVLEEIAKKEGGEN